MICEKVQKKSKGEMMMLMMMVGSGDDAQEFPLNYIGATRFAFHSLVVDT